MKVAIFDRYLTMSVGISGTGQH